MKTSQLKIAIIFITIVFFSACSPKGPALQIYTLNTEMNSKQIYSPAYHSKSLKVAYPTSIKGVMSTKMSYSYSSIEEGTYNNARWSSTASKLLMNTLMRTLDDSRLFASTIEYSSAANADYLLESEVYDFYHKIRGERSVAALSIRFNLIRINDSTLVRSKKFEYEIPTETFDAKGYAKATNRAITQLTIDLTRWLAR